MILFEERESWYRILTYLTVLCCFCGNIFTSKANPLNATSTQTENIDTLQLPHQCEQILDPRMFDRTNTLANRTWPNGRVPYVLDLPIRDQDLKVFYSVLDQYHYKTCVRFVPKTAADTNFILVQVSKEHKNRCGAAVVCNYQVPNQFIEIDLNCAHSMQNWAHELGHVLCLIHEQERVDRNQYISYDGCPPGNIPQTTPAQDDLGTLYDYASCLHYPCWGKCWGTPSRHGVKKCGVELHDTGLSILDIDKLNLIYNCGWCHRRRWYSVYRLTDERVATLVDFSSMPGDQSRGAIYACRVYVGDEGEVAVGTCEPAGKYGWKCLVAWNNEAVVAEPNFELLALPYGGNKVPVKDGGTNDLDYRLVSNRDGSVKQLYIPAGRTIVNGKIYIGVIHAKTEFGQMGTYIGKVYAQDAGKPQNRALIVVQGKYYEAVDYYVVACS